MKKVQLIDRLNGGTIEVTATNAANLIKYNPSRYPKVTTKKEGDKRIKIIDTIDAKLIEISATDLFAYQQGADGRYQLPEQLNFEEMEGEALALAQEAKDFNKGFSPVTGTAKEKELSEKNNKLAEEKKALEEKIKALEAAMKPEPKKVEPKKKKA